MGKQSILARLGGTAQISNRDDRSSLQYDPAKLIYHRARKGEMEAAPDALPKQWGKKKICFQAVQLKGGVTEFAGI